MASDLKIDHATVAGSDLKKMQAALAAVGLPSVYGGAHTNHTTEMALISFPDGSYLELMGIQPGADPQLVAEHVWSRFLSGDAGPCAWAVREPDIAAEVRRLEAAGVPVSSPVKSGRRRPDGVQLDWQTSDVGARGRGTFFPFLIQDFTSRDQRAFPQGKPTSRDFRGVGKIVIAVKNLDEAIARYHQAYAVPPPLKQVDKDFGAHLAQLSGAPVILAQPLGADSWLNQRLDRFGEAPCAFLLSAGAGKKFRAASKARWFGAEVEWFDPAALGWRLGVERGN
jgi:Glyoxalase-like domain